MPEHKSCQKRIKSDAKKRKRNHYLKQTIKTLTKKFEASNDKAEMEKLLPNIYSKIDKAAKKNILHKNKAAREKSRLSKLLDKL